MTVICTHAKQCRNALACQHGNPHEQKSDCEREACINSGAVRCKPWVPSLAGNSEDDNAGK